MEISTAALPSLVQLYTLIGNTSLGLRGGSPNICSTPVTLPSLLTHIQSSNSLQLPHSLSKQSICQRRPRSRPWLHYQRSVRCASTTNDIPSDSLKLLLGVDKAILGASILVLPIYDRDMKMTWSQRSSVHFVVAVGYQLLRFDQSLRRLLPKT